MSVVTGKAKIDVLVVKPLLHNSGIWSGPTLNICDTARIHMTLGEASEVITHTLCFCH